MPEILPVSSPVSAPPEMPAQPAAVAVFTPPADISDKKDAELRSLREEVLSLRSEIAELRQSLRELSKPAPVMKPSATKAATPKPATAKTATAKTAAAVKAPAPKAQAAGGPKSILPDDATPDSIIKPTPGGTFAVHLGSYRAPEMAIEGWRTLVKAYPTLLPAFTPQTAPLIMGGEDGKHYRLLAGPLGSRDDALKLCQKLAANAGFCAPTEFTGTPLTGEAPQTMNNKP